MPLPSSRPVVSWLCDALQRRHNKQAAWAVGMAFLCLHSLPDLREPSSLSHLGNWSQREHRRQADSPCWKLTSLISLSSRSRPPKLEPAYWPTWRPGTPYSSWLSLLHCAGNRPYISTGSLSDLCSVSSLSTWIMQIRLIILVSTLDTVLSPNTLIMPARAT